MADINVPKQKLEEIVQCLVCKAITHSKILQCPNGHLTCDRCSTRITNCPMCRSSLNPNVNERTRALAVEQIIEAMNLNFKCRNGDCGFSGPKGDLMEHQNTCEHSQEDGEPKNTGYGMFIQASCRKFCHYFLFNFLARWHYLPFFDY